MRSLTETMLIVIIALVLLAGCGGQKAQTPIQEATGETISNIPDWYLSPPANDANYNYATATASSRDLQLALDKATTTALNILSQGRETQVAGMQKRFQEEVGTEADAQLLDQFTQCIENVTSTTLTGTSKVNSTALNENGMFRAYVLYKHDLNASAKQLLDEMKKQEELYTRFRATQAFDELEQKVKNTPDK